MFECRLREERFKVGFEDVSESGVSWWGKVAEEVRDGIRVFCFYLVLFVLFEFI